MKITPILLTSSVIAHDNGVALKNSKERIFHTLESIKRWRTLAPDCPIVICDGSSFDFTELINGILPNAKLECLKFENSIENIKKYGRGYGEGEIVKFAIQNSDTIKKHSAFAKCTAKLWVNNFDACRSKWNGNFLGKGVFRNQWNILETPELSYIDTRFYISSIKFYREYLWDAHNKIKKDAGFGLEESFQEILLQSGEDNILFSIYPVISGTGGGTGKAYRTSWIRRLKEELKLKNTMNSARYQHLFQK